jgi:hypothetical protein
MGKSFLLLHSIEPGVESNKPPMKFVWSAFSPGVNQQGREVSSDVKSDETIPPLHISLHGLVLIELSTEEHCLLPLCGARVSVNTPF